MSEEVQLRPLVASDQDFLWDMLHVALWDPPPAGLRPREVLEEPRIAVHAEDFGSKRDDLGFVAQRGAVPIGAVWSRLHVEEGVGGAWFDERTPQLGIALLPGERGRGVGSQLFEVYLKAADRRFDAVSLAVHPENPARRLYERFGFEEFARGPSDYRLMVRRRPKQATQNEASLVAD
ncbi:MAG: GNAT family N-acetyltransferase [Planctomycetota bacterium]